jgi:hypothetical protein
MKLINKGIYILSLLLLSIPFACTEEDDDFSIIEGLNFSVATLNAEGTQAGVIPTTVPGDGRIVFTVDFGDSAEDLKDVFQTSGPMVTYKYPKESATYTITVTASLDGKEDVSITKEHTIVYVDTSLPEPETGLYDGFEGNGNIEGWFGDGATIDTSFANPFSNTDNDSCGVLKYVDNGTGQYANIRFDVKPNFDLSEDAVFTLKVYVPSSSITGTQTNQIALKLQDGSHAQPWTTQTEIIKPVVLDQWQEITFDFENDAFKNWSTITTDPVDRTDLNRVVIQMNSENNFDSVTAYLDDLVYE